MDLVADLQARGLVQDATDLDALAKRLAEGPIGAYVGFDPTADSLHVGHLVGQLTLRRLQLAGHRPFPLAGGATGMVGDPSGRSEERNLLDRETLRHNVARITAQLERILDFSPGPFQAELVDNADWTAEIPVLDFLRDVGKHVTVNQMLAKESVRSRMESEQGLSFTEFSYMLLQANDFRWLLEHRGVELQMGGSDQWGNITAGIDLIRRTLGASVHGLTWPLVARSDGAKMGKTASGAVWLDPERTSPYQFRQFWVQVPDTDVQRFLLQFTFRSVDDVDALVAEHQVAPERRVAQRALAHDVTAVVHGEEAALEVVRREVPGTTIPAGTLDDLVAILVRTGLASSNSDARRTLTQGGFRANGRVLGEQDTLTDVRPLADRFLLLRRGKSSYHLLEISPATVDGRHPGR
jgi:tyrosyl-tRNA synthetase